MKILEAVRQAYLVTECAEQLEGEEREVLEILLDEDGEKIVRIAELLEVSLPTAYRRKDGVLHRLSELFRENSVRIS